MDQYGPVVAGLENDIDEIEDQLFGGDPEVSRRIFALLREVIEFQRDWPGERPVRLQLGLLMDCTAQSLRSSLRARDKGDSGDARY